MSEAVIIGLIGLAVFFILLFLGLKIGTAMALVGFVGFIFLVSFGGATLKLAVSPFTTITNYGISVLPLFILMASLCFSARFTESLFKLANAWLGVLPGGLAIASIGACAVFACISASSLATAMTIGMVALPEMKKNSYSPELYTGSIICGGTLGCLIPPSNSFILYGVLTQTSIGKLFISGIVPGIILALLYMFAILIVCLIKPKSGPRQPNTSWKEKFAPLLDCGEIIFLIALVLGGMFVGWFTPTEAAAVGAFGAILVSMVRKRLTWSVLKNSLFDTAKTTGMIYFLLVGAFLMNFFLTASTLPTILAQWVSALSIPPLGVIGIIVIIYILLGCFIDAVAMLLLTIPIFFPLVTALGFDPIWFGVIIVLMGEIAVITPPVGMNIFAVSGLVPDVSMSTMYKGVMPFVIAAFVMTALIIFFPSLTLWLPGFMK